MAVCSVVGVTCVAPAGYRTGQGFARAPSVRLPRCYPCGQPVCRNCSMRVGRSVVCAQCAEDFASRVFG